MSILDSQSMHPRYMRYSVSRGRALPQDVILSDHPRLLMGSDVISRLGLVLRNVIVVLRSDWELGLLLCW